MKEPVTQKSDVLQGTGIIARLLDPADERS